MYSYNPYYYEYLAHHGVKGQKWGIRRYQPYTSGQKGIFKNLKRSYKNTIRSLKKQRRKYEEQGNTKAAAAATKAIRDTKSAYKSDKKGLKEQFRSENWENYKQEVAERGNEKEVKKVYKELSPAQLEIANARLSKMKDFQKMSLRDVNKEYADEQKNKKMDAMIKKAEFVGKIAVTANSVLSAYKNFRDIFKGKSEHELKMETLAEKEKEANIAKTEAETFKDKSLAKKTLKDAGIYTYQMQSDMEKSAYDTWKNSKSSSTVTQPSIKNTVPSSSNSASSGKYKIVSSSETTKPRTKKYQVVYDPEVSKMLERTRTQKYNVVKAAIETPSSGKYKIVDDPVLKEALSTIRTKKYEVGRWRK